MKFSDINIETITCKQEGEKFVFNYEDTRGRPKTVTLDFQDAFKLYNTDVLIPSEPDHFLRLIRQSRNAQQFVVQRYEQLAA